MEEKDIPTAEMGTTPQETTTAVAPEDITPAAAETAAPSEGQAAEPVKDKADKGERLPLRRKWIPVAIIGFVLCLAAWFALFFSETTSIILAGVSLVLSILGVRVRRSIWRDLAITSIIASAVLLVVYAIFFFGIDILVNSI